MRHRFVTLENTLELGGIENIVIPFLANIRSKQELFRLFNVNGLLIIYCNSNKMMVNEVWCNVGNYSRH